MFFWSAILTHFFYSLILFSKEVVIFISNIQCTYRIMHAVVGENGGGITFATE